MNKVARVFVGLWLMSLTLPSAWGSGPAARVSSCVGRAQALDTPLRANARLEEGAVVDLGEGGRLHLTFYRDGHREELSGPCLARVKASGCQVLRGDGRCLVRVVAQRRELVLPQRGNIDALGGSIASTSDPGTASTSGFRVRGSKPKLRPLPSDDPTPTASSPHRSLAIRFEEGRPSFDWPGTAEGFRFELKGPGTDRVLAVEEQSVVIPPELKFKAGAEYRLAIWHNGRLVRRIPFRIIDSSQEKRLAELATSIPTDATQAARTMDELERLGYPSLAALQGEKWLSRGLVDVGILSYLHSLYAEVLGDQESAKSLRLRAQKSGYRLGS